MIELVERLAAKYRAEVDRGIVQWWTWNDGTRWWLNAIADELEAECAGIDGWTPRSGFSVVKWLRGQPEFPEQARATHESETTEQKDE